MGRIGVVFDREEESKLEESKAHFSRKWLFCRWRETVITAVRDVHGSGCVIPLYLY